jgi:hypothetical protein
MQFFLNRDRTNLFLFFFGRDQFGSESSLGSDFEFGTDIAMGVLEPDPAPARLNLAGPAAIRGGVPSVSQSSQYPGDGARSRAVLPC